MEIQNVVCENVPSICGIRVTVASERENINGIVYLIFRRTNMATNQTKTLIRKSVSELADLSFVYEDVEVVAGHEYRYIVTMTGASESDVVVQGTGRAVCEFDGLSIADSTSSWKTAFGSTSSQYSESYKRTRQVQYVTTLSGQYPHRVSNSNSNYMTGSVTALWVPLGPNCGEPTFPSETDAYREAFIEFLQNGERKLLRASDGKAMIVSIDNDVTENWNPVTKLSTVTFNWTQLGELDKQKYIPTSPGWSEEVIT